jgi:hypothetical protein
MKWFTGFLTILILLSLTACGPGVTIMPEDAFPPADPTPFPTIVYPEPPATAVPRIDAGDDGAYPAPSDDLSGLSEVSWETAQDLIMSGEVVEVFQAHSLGVELVLKDGQHLTTVEPQIDAVFEVIESCGAKCADVVIITE